MNTNDKTINEELKGSITVSETKASKGIQGIHKVNLDSENNKIAATNTIRLIANTVIAAPGNPTTYTYTLGGDQIDVNGLTKLLADKEVRQEFLDELANSTRINELIEAITSARYGQFATNSDSLSFEMVRDRIQSVSKVSLGTVYALANIFTPLRTITGINAASNTIQTFKAETEIYPTAESLVQHLVEQEIESYLNDIKYDFIDGSKKKVGVADVAAKYESAFFPLQNKFNQLLQIERSYQAVLALVKSYVLKDFDAYQPEEQIIFSDDRFLQLASNFTVIKHALETQPNRPAMGYAFWISSVERIAIGIAASKKYFVTELAAVKELYTVSNVTENRGFKKAVIISRNLKEDTVLATYRVKNVGQDLSRLYEDSSTNIVLGSIYKSFTSIDTTHVHNYAERCFQNLVGSESEFYLYALGIPEEELEYLAMIFSGQVLLSLDDYENGKGNVTLLYQLNVKDSLIDDNLKTFMNYSMVKNKLVALFYAPEHSGKTAITIKNNPISNTKHTLFKDIRGILGSSLAEKVSFTMKYQNQVLKPKWDIGRLTGLVDLADTHCVVPIVGSVIFDQLIATHRSMLNLYREDFSKNESLGLTAQTLESANLSFVQVLTNILTNKDIDNILNAAIGSIWSESDHVKTRFANSIFAEDRFNAEFRVRMVLFLAAKLGFIEDQDHIKVILAALRDSGAFSRMLIIGSES